MYKIKNLLIVVMIAHLGSLSSIIAMDSGKKLVTRQYKDRKSGEVRTVDLDFDLDHVKRHTYFQSEEIDFDYDEVRKPSIYYWENDSIEVYTWQYKEEYNINIKRNCKTGQYSGTKSRKGPEITTWVGSVKSLSVTKYIFERIREYYEATTKTTY